MWLPPSTCMTSLITFDLAQIFDWGCFQLSACGAQSTMRACLSSMSIRILSWTTNGTFFYKPRIEITPTHRTHVCHNYYIYTWADELYRSWCDVKLCMSISGHDPWRERIRHAYDGVVVYIDGAWMHAGPGAWEHRHTRCKKTIAIIK